MAGSLNMERTDLAPAGSIDVEGDFVSRVVRDENVYKKMVLGENRAIGCIVPGDSTG